MRVPTRLVLVAALLALAACSPTVNLSTALQVDVVSSGWFDAGIENGKNKLVPSVSFTLRNGSERDLVMLQVNAIFRRVTGSPDSEFGRAFVTAADSSGLAPGATSPVLTVRADFGYTGIEPRLEILQNSQFVDGRVELIAKYGSSAWMRLGEYPIERRLITK